MPDPYHQLLEATIQHLEQLKASGVRHVKVSPENLAALAKANPVAVKPAAKISLMPAAPEAIAKPSPARTPRTAPTIMSAPNTLPPAGPKKLVDPATLAAFEELRQRAMTCIKCPHLAASRTQVVFGVGDITADLMFVGEAPGAEEDRLGEPFVGKAGQLLTKIIQTMGLSRETVYIANILKCRPDTPGQSFGNRKPTTVEMATCLPYLLEQIELVKPKVLVALGATGVEGLLGKTIGITKLRGNWQTFQNIPLMPTYHPSYLLRNQLMSEKRRVWEDMLAVMEKLGMAISEKQQNFFRG